MNPSTPSSAEPCSILVTGDVIRDIYVYEGDREYPAQQGSIPPHLSDGHGGARCLYELIAKAGGAAVSWGFSDPIPLESIHAVHTLWVACDGGTEQERADAPKSAKPKKVWRVKQSLGYALDSQAAVPSKSAAADSRHTVMVLDDAGLAFRNLPAKGSWPVGISRDEEPQPDWIVHKMGNPIAQGDLWRALIRCANSDARRENLIVIVAADELRRGGAAISRGFSWERTLSELCRELNHNPLFQPLLRFPQHLIVNFGCVGSVWFNAANCGQAADWHAQDRAMLVYDPTLPEGGWKTRLAGKQPVYGHLNTFTTAIALALAELHESKPKEMPRATCGQQDVPSQPASATIECTLPAAIGRGLAACRELRLHGHGGVKDGTPGLPFAALKPILAPISPEGVLNCSMAKGFHPVSSACGRFKPEDEAVWTLTALAENPPEHPTLPLYGLAHRVALYGFSALDTIPHAHFGSMVSVDRGEIETLRSLTQLIQRYQEEKQPKQPLCIAAFGPPGAGKSFGIEQIARQILGEEIPILKFNLSQFDTSSDLFGAFHEVRDKVLTGFIPVVFWDEFDSRNYDWLQYLLAPMQDGTFQESGHTHAIGKCIFVFAGATSWDFTHFGPAPMPEPGDLKAVQAVEKRCSDNRDLKKAEGAANDEFRRKKGPDFLSRLDAHINVLGPNQRMIYDWFARAWTTPDDHDITFPVRRALLLRQFLGAKKPGDLLAIDRDLLRAFLLVPRYRYGARSMEKIARHLAISRKPYRRAHLPPPQVLAQHLDTDRDFEDIYLETRRTSAPQAVEVLANAINEGYNNDNPGPWNKPFNDLSSFLQQSNRAAALRIPHILALAGLRLMRRRHNPPDLKMDDPLSVKRFLDAPLDENEQAVFNHLERHLEVLAEEEHRLWCQFHEENGWTYGSRLETKPHRDDPSTSVTTFEKDGAVLKHPCLRPFHEMPDDHGQLKKWQDYDRNAVRRYPRLLRLTDFEIAFLEQSKPI